jgi:hypothetical protein
LNSQDAKSGRAQASSTLLMSDHFVQRPLMPWEARLITLDGAIIEAETHSTSIVYDGTPAKLGSVRDISDANGWRRRCARARDVIARSSNVRRMGSSPTRLPRQWNGGKPTGAKRSATVTGGAVRRCPLRSLSGVSGLTLWQHRRRDRPGVFSSEEVPDGGVGRTNYREP